MLYPDIVFGAIASSGVTHATIENWEYMDIIRGAAEPECSEHLVSSIAVIDRVLAIPHLRLALKSLFGLGDLVHDDDFAAVISVRIIAVILGYVLTSSFRVHSEAGRRRTGIRKLAVAVSMSSAKPWESLSPALPRLIV